MKQKLESSTKQEMRNKAVTYLLFSFLCWTQLPLPSSSNGILRVGLNYGETAGRSHDSVYFKLRFIKAGSAVLQSYNSTAADYRGQHQIFFTNKFSASNNINNPLEVPVSDNRGEVLLRISVYDENHRDVLIHEHNIILITVHGHSVLGLENSGAVLNVLTPIFKYIKLSYSFMCNPGYVDKLCTCMDKDNAGGHYTCGAGGAKICLNGWTDPSNNCLVPDACFNAPCKNNGWCIRLAGANFKCDCQYGYWGPTCEKSCASLPCKNGGTCVPYGNGFKCDCSPGFSGKECEKSGCDASSGYPCGEGIECKLLATGDFACYCLPGYSGENCEDVDECKLSTNNLCLNGGTCRNTKGSYACDCPDKFTGNRCQDRKSACDQVQCKTGETCLDTKEGTRCVPVDGTDCTPGICNNGGKCIEKNLHYVCLCLPGFHGPTCTDTDRGV